MRWKGRNILSYTFISECLFSSLRDGIVVLKLRSSSVSVLLLELVWWSACLIKLRVKLCLPMFAYFELLIKQIFNHSAACKLIRLDKVSLFQ